MEANLWNTIGEQIGYFVLRDENNNKYEDDSIRGHFLRQEISNDDK